MFATDDPPFASKDHEKLDTKRERKRSPGTEQAVQNGTENSAFSADEDEEEGRRGGLTKPVNSAGGTLRYLNLPQI